MLDSDDYGNSDDEALLIAATQAETDLVQEDEFDSSPRPGKRRRLNENGDRAQTNRSREEASQTLSEEDAFDSAPSVTINQRQRANSGQNVNGFASVKEPKPKHKIRVLNHGAEFEDSFLTQAPTVGSSPSRLRGPIWLKKPPPPVEIPKGAKITQSVPVSDFLSRRCISVVNEEEGDSALPVARTATLGRPHGTNAQSSKPQADSFDVDQELADLPSDAFASSSSQPASPVEHFLLRAPINGLRQTTLFGRGPAAQQPASQVNKRHNWPLAQKAEPPTHHQLNVDAMETWVYPTNLGKIRDYQFNIVARGLFHNLLVALPTGLGKTFIAATIMLNWFRWTTDAQIVFVAPTKPLVSQQIEACFGIAGIPRSYTTMLTGDIQPGIRAEEWNTKRVFFMTPQTLINDLKTGICNPKNIVLLVVDEAHRATGGYAYVEVVSFIRRFNESFRVLALTATPGSDVESVQKVIDGLDISRVEIRTEHSIDIREYVHSRKIEKVVFDVSEEMSLIMDLYAKATQPVVNILAQHNAYWNKDPLALTPFGLTKARQQWMNSDAGRNANQGIKGMLNSIFTLLASLSHNVSLLQYHGIVPFYHGMLAFRNDVAEKKSKYRRQINENENFEKMMSRLRGWTGNVEFLGHPKLEYLQSVVLNHFMDAGEGRHGDHPPSSTRIMVFAHFRDSAEDIVRVLKRNQPMIRPHVFVGQATAKNSEGMNQKSQLDVVQKFKSGVYNTLVATSIGEEGLDIGEVDLIICYDSKASPIRMLQRMGRTGRKRAGNIVLLQMRGKEEEDASKAKDSYEKMQEMIALGDRFTFYDDRSRRIVPKDIQPLVDKRKVDIPIENSQSNLPIPTRKGRGRIPKRPPKKFHMPDGVRTGFVNASRMEDDDDDHGADLPKSRKKRTTEASFQEVATIPPLSEVLLNPLQQQELGSKYLNVYDDEETVRVVVQDLGKYPDRQRYLCQTKYCPHGSRTTAFAETMKRIHDHDVDKSRIEEWENVLDQTLLEPGDYSRVTEGELSQDEEESVPNIHASRPRRPTPKTNPVAKQRKKATTKRRQTGMSSPPMEGRSSSPPQSSARMRVPSQGIWLGSQDSGGNQDDEEEGMDSDLADFIADDNEPVQMVTSSLPLPMESSAALSKPFYVSQQLPNTQDDSDLPELGDLVGKKAKPVTAPQPVALQQQPKRNRRVVEESDDDE